MIPFVPHNLNRRPLPVAYLIDELKVGGTERQLLRLLSTLNRTKVAPHLVLLRSAPRDQQNRLERLCRTKQLQVSSLRSIAGARGLFRLMRWLHRRKIRVLQLYFPDSTILGLLAGILAGVHRIVRTQFNLGTEEAPLYRLLNRLLARFFDAAVTNSRSVRTATIARYAGLSKKILTIANGVSACRAQAGRPTRNAHAPKIVGVVGNYRRIKQLDLVIEAAAQVAKSFLSVVFVLVGEGPERSSLQDLIRRHGCACTILLPGTLGDIPGFLAAVDLAVLFSRSEGQPNAVLEYMAAAKPMIVTSVGGAKELVRHRHNGLVVPCDDPRRLAQAILQLLRDNVSAHRYARTARRSLERQGDGQRSARKYETLYQYLDTPHGIGSLGS